VQNTQSYVIANMQSIIGQQANIIGNLSAQLADANKKVNDDQNTIKSQIAMIDALKGGQSSDTTQSDANNGQTDEQPAEAAPAAK
jgi:hypothetical protein